MRTLAIFCLVLSLSFADQASKEDENSRRQFQQSPEHRTWPPPGLGYGSPFDTWGRSPVPIILVGVAFFICQFIIAFFSLFDGKLLTGQFPGRSSGDTFTGQLHDIWQLASKAIDYWTEENEEN